VGKRLGGLVGRIALKAATLNAMESAHIEELKDIGTTFAEGISEIGGDLIEKKIEGYTSEKDALKAFKESLKALAAIVRKKQEFPLTIIVDELDRCRPDFALQLLERIKHLFDVEGVSFVLLVNREQIETYVRAVYGKEVDASAYLLKFGTLFVDLPVFASSQRGLQGKDLYCDRLFDHFGFQDRVRRDETVFGVGALANHFLLTMRDLERLFSRLAIFYASNKPHSIFDPFLVPLVAVAQMKFPQVFAKMKSASISNRDFFQLTELGQIKKTEDSNYPVTAGITLLRVLLMSESEFETPIHSEEDSSEILHGLKRRFSNSLNRAEIIPSICGNLEKFSFKPS
jgi:hypothetical protein